MRRGQEHFDVDDIFQQFRVHQSQQEECRPGRDRDANRAALTFPSYRRHSLRYPLEVGFGRRIRQRPQVVKQRVPSGVLAGLAIEAHRANIMRKLQLRSVSDLVRYAIRNNIVQP